MLEKTAKELGLGSLEAAAMWLYLNTGIAMGHLRDALSRARGLRTRCMVQECMSAIRQGNFMLATDRLVKAYDAAKRARKWKT